MIHIFTLCHFYCLNYAHVAYSFSTIHICLSAQQHLFSVLLIFSGKRIDNGCMCAYVLLYMKINLTIRANGETVTIRFSHPSQQINFICDELFCQRFIQSPNNETMRIQKSKMFRHSNKIIFHINIKCYVLFCWYHWKHRCEVLISFYRLHLFNLFKGMLLNELWFHFILNFIKMNSKFH